MAKERLFVEQRPQGDYAVRKPDSERASAILPTQAKAIERARELKNLACLRLLSGSATPPLAAGTSGVSLSVTHIRAKCSAAPHDLGTCKGMFVRATPEPYSLSGACYTETQTPRHRR